MIRQYKQKEPEFLAIQWEGNNLQEVRAFFNEVENLIILQDTGDNTTLYVKQNERENFTKINFNDYIIKNDQGVFWTMDASNFDQGYELKETEEDTLIP